MAKGRRQVQNRQGRRGGALRGIFRWIAVLVVLFLLLLSLLPLTAASLRITNGAMSPTIEIGQTVGVNHLAYLLLNPKRGDIVQFSSQESAREDSYVRRVIGLPGETVQIMEGSVFINGHQLEEPYASGLTQYAGTASSALTLTQDEYFVLADNRSNNFDSRDPTVGNLSSADIRGKVWLRILPFDEAGIVK